MENDGMLPDDKPVHIGRGRYPEPAYTAAVVQIDKENAKVLAFDSLYELQAGEDDELQTQFKILASRTLARRVVEDLHLNKRGEMTPAAPGIYDLAKQRAQHIASDIFHTLLSPKIDSASTPPSNETDELKRYVD